MKERVLICFNPVSGKGRASTYVQELLKYAAKHKIDCLLLESSKNEEVLFKALDSLDFKDFKALIVVGGDGLVHQVLQSLTGSDLPVFVLPAGTGNDFARTNRILDLSPGKVFGRIYESEPNCIDLGSIHKGASTKVFGQILSTGFDAEVNQRANKNRYISGKMKYNLATLFELPRFEPIRYSLEIDGANRDVTAMLIAIANGPSYGGGMQLVPHADRSDGKLDIMILHPVSKIELLKVFPKVYRGRHVNHPAVEFLKGSSIKISAQTVAFADGERVSTLPITVDALPQSLRVWSS